MSCYIGITVQHNIIDTKNYQLALSQIQNYAQQSSLSIQSHPYILTLTNGQYKYYFPKNGNYLHSTLQQYTISQSVDQQFIQTIAECLMILKQHLHHQVQIQIISQLDFILNIKHKISQQIPRRLINYLKIMQSRIKKQDISQQQVHMLISNISTQYSKQYDQKIKSLSLKILAQGKISSQIWTSLSKQAIKIIDKIVNDPNYQKSGIQVLQRIIRNNQYNPIALFQEKQNNQPNQNSLSSSQQEVFYNNGPLDPMTALFQLKQSLNLSRINNIIQNINCKELTEKQLLKFDNRIKEIVQKFMNGLFQSSSTNQIKYFGKVVSQYEMRRDKLRWNGLVEQLLIKIQQTHKQKSKRKVRPRQS